jgi:hypothetical protein
VTHDCVRYYLVQGLLACGIVVSVRLGALIKSTSSVLLGPSRISKIVSTSQLGLIVTRVRAVRRSVLKGSAHLKLIFDAG